MHTIPVPADEIERLKALESYHVLDTREARAYEAFTQLALDVTGAQMSAISLVDENRQWFKSRRGIDYPEAPREHAFCAYVVAAAEPMVVDDATVDERFRDNPYVLGDPGIRFYAGVPLRSPEGHTIGTLCVMDSRPRTIGEAQLRTLVALSEALMRMFEGRRRFLSLFDAARIDMFTVDAQTQTIFFASRGACERLGYSLKELIGMSVYDIMPDMSEGDFRGALSASARGEQIDRETKLLRSDGTSYPVELRIYAGQEDGQMRVNAVAIDLTKRREQEQEIALLLGAINVAGDVILVYRVEGDTLSLSYANDAFARQTGYAPQEAIGRGLEFFRKAMPDDEGMHVVRGALAAGTPTQAEIVSYRKDGSTYWNQVTLHPIRNENGTITHWISIERDISDEVERNAALAEEHDRLLALTRAARRLFTALDASAVVSIVYEVVDQLLACDTRVLAVDDDGASVAVHALGALDWDTGTLDPLIERTVTQRVRVTDERGTRAIAYSGRFGDARYVLEIRSRHNRALRNTDLFVFDLIAEYFSVAVRNVSLYHEVEERRSAVLELNQTKSDLIAMLAHDFRGPLTSIVGFADLAAEVGDVNGEQREFLDTIKASALQLSELATDTLTLARLERNEVALQLTQTDLGDLIASIILALRERRTVELAIDGDARVIGDDDRLRQVFTNLIDNAIKYTPEGPDPQVRVIGGHDDVTVRVRDFGIGIPPGELSRVFDRFSRASNARKMRIAGTGFGLFLTKQLVQLHGGTIAVESEEGGGSTFTVVLPRRVDRRNAPRTILLLATGSDGSFLVYGLQEAGYRVLTATSIEEAIATADAQPIDAVLLATPETLSNHAAVQFRAFSRERNMPLVAIGDGGSAHLGASASLSRPVAIGDVVSTLERLLG